MEIKLTIIALLSMFIVSCTTTETLTTSPFPVEPKWAALTRTPVLGSVERDGNKNFEVSDEFMEKSLQMKSYIDRISDWKKRT